MSKYQLPTEVNSLAAALTRMPGIGPKMANRLAIYIAARNLDDGISLARAINKLSDAVGVCPMTGNLASKGQLCSIYSSADRDRSMLMVVETPLDLIQIEDSGQYSGLYVVLGGLISPLNGIGPEMLAFDKLSGLLDKESVTEVILALSPTVEGEATSLYTFNYISKLAPNISVTRLARGLPTGVSLEFLDTSTLTSALKSRSVIE